MALGISSLLVSDTLNQLLHCLLTNTDHAMDSHLPLDPHRRRSHLSTTSYPKA